MSDHDALVEIGARAVYNSAYQPDEDERWESLRPGRDELGNHHENRIKLACIRDAEAVLAAIDLPARDLRVKREVIDQLATAASEWEPMLHVEEITVGEDYGNVVNLSLWIWIEVQGKMLLKGVTP